MKTKPCILFFLLAALLAGAAPARGDVLNSVKGTIRDQKTGLPIAGVRITLVSARNANLRIDLLSGGDGTVYKNGIPTGGFEVQFEREGYFPARSSIRLTIGDSFDISTRLEPVPAQGADATSTLRAVVELVKGGDFAAAGKKAGDALAQEPANAMLYYYRGYCSEKSGDAAAAGADYGRAVELKPDFVLALTSLGKLQARQGEYAAAAEHYKKALALAPGDPDAIYNYGICLVNLGESAAAREAFEKLLALDPDNPDACYQLGIVLLGLGDMAKAKEYLKKFLALDPQHKDAPFARQIIDSIK